MTVPLVFRLLGLCALLGFSSHARAEIAPSAETVQPLIAGTKAPTFSLTSADGSTVDLADVFAAKPTVLIFYRGGWCPFCNRHLAALAEMELKLRALGFQIVGISPDDLAALASTREKHQLRYRLLSDREMRATPAYGLAYRIPAEVEPAYRANDIQLPPIPKSPDFWLPVPAAFIVGRDGVIKFVYSNADPELRVSEETLLAAAQAASK